MLRPIAAAPSAVLILAGWLAPGSADPRPPDRLAPAVALCTPDHVFGAKDRVHVRCLGPAGGIVFFAVPTADQGRAVQLLQKGFQALASGGKLRIEYDLQDTGGANWGCLVHDCRPAISIQPVPGLANGKGGNPK